MDENPTPHSWQNFANSYDAYERLYRTGQYQEARAELQKAMLSCPSSSMLTLLEVQYRSFKEVRPWNLWTVLMQSFGSPKQLPTRITPTQR